MKSSHNNPGTFGLGSQIFGGQTDTSSVGPAAQKDDTNESDEDSEDSSPSDDEVADALVTALASTTLEASDWSSAPAYGTLYLSTIAEYLPPAPKPKVPLDAQVNEDEAEGDKSKDASWALEGYENSLDIDHAFERFSKRVGYEGEQCLRCDFCPGVWLVTN